MTVEYAFGYGVYINGKREGMYWSNSRMTVFRKFLKQTGDIATWDLEGVERRIVVKAGVK